MLEILLRFIIYVKMIYIRIFPADPSKACQASSRFETYPINLRLFNWRVPALNSSPHLNFCVVAGTIFLFSPWNTYIFSQKAINDAFNIASKAKYEKEKVSFF